MIWSDKKIRERLLSTGAVLCYDERMVNPASLNVRLGSTFLTMSNERTVTLGDTVHYVQHDTDENHCFILYPNEFCLATTREYFSIPNDAVAFVQGRSSIGRIGLTVQNAGYVDPGFKGEITLELVNESPVPIKLPFNYPVAQLVFMDCHDVEKPYQGKYTGQIGATGSRMNQDVGKYHMKEGENV